MPAVFTRTVADSSLGIKLAGKAGAHALGFTLPRDRMNNLILPTNESSTLASVDHEVTGAVARYRMDVGKGSTLGLLYVGREAEGYRNRVGGIDAFLDDLFEPNAKE